MEKVLDNKYLTNYILSFYQSEDERRHRINTTLNCITLEISHARWIEREFYLYHWNSDLQPFLTMPFHIYLLLHLRLWKQNDLFYGKFATNIKYTDLIEIEY
tara:strand:- start:243 stop:548 length:306 start_codon:yes stop_codon:yes gene_type:complete